MADPDITLYRSPGSRAYYALWMLEELGVPYRSVMFDIRPGGWKPDGFDKLNPHLQSPTLTDGDAVVSEGPAICMFLADRYGYGELCPRIEDPRRGPYLKWCVYSTAVLEAARGTQGIPRSSFERTWGVGWRPLAEVQQVLSEAVSKGPWLLGDMFTAADVMIGAVLGIGIFTGSIQPDASLQAYNDRIAARPACQRAGAINWPG